jgi:hypothetical protein
MRKFIPMNIKKSPCYSFDCPKSPGEFIFWETSTFPRFKTATHLSKKLKKHLELAHCLPREHYPIK